MAETPTLDYRGPNLPAISEPVKLDFHGRVILPPVRHEAVCALAWGTRLFVGSTVLASTLNLVGLWYMNAMIMLPLAGLVAIVALAGVVFLARGRHPVGRYWRYVGESALWCGVGVGVVIATCGKFVACHGS